MDLSKSFDTIYHILPIAKLNAYGFSASSIKCILSYLKRRWGFVVTMTRWDGGQSKTNLLTLKSCWLQILQF